MGTKLGAPAFEFDQEIANRILFLIVEHEEKSIKSILKMEDDFPSYHTLLRWLKDNDDFRDLYARVAYDRYSALGEKFLEVADDESIKPDDRRIRVDARKWFLSKMLPKQFGDKVVTEISGPNGDPIKSEISVVEYTIVDVKNNSDSEK